MRIVILGGGFAGLSCAKALARASVQVTLLDRENHHCFQPLLYQAATAALAPNDVAWPIREILRDAKNVRVLMAEARSVDLLARTIEAEEASLPYDVLVIATGVAHAYFGHDEWAQFAPGLKRVEDAIAIRRRLLASFERAERIDDPALREALMTFVVVGGGPTGVEMAGAIAELAHHALARQFRGIDPSQARVILVEAGPRLLGAFPPDLAEYAASVLRRRRVEVRLDLARIGRDAAIVRLDGVKLTGFAGWLFWSLAHIYFLIGARNRIAVAFNWAWDYVTRQRGVRLITRSGAES